MIIGALRLRRAIESIMMRMKTGRDLPPAKLCTISTSSAGSTGFVKWFWNPALAVSLPSTG